MKFFLLLILVPQIAMASALVVKDDLNKIFNVIAVLDFPETEMSDFSAAKLTYETDLYLNNLMPEIQIAGETWTILFNLDYQLGYTKYPLSKSCSHNKIEQNKDFNVQSFVAEFVSGLGSTSEVVSVENIIKLPFSSLSFNQNLSCFGEGLPLEI